MRRSELLQGIREMKFISVRKRFTGGEISQIQAAELLGISDRTFRRWCERYREDDPDSLADRRLGRPARNRVPEAEAELVEVLYRQTYAGFTAKHFHEHLVRAKGSAGATRGPSRCCNAGAC